MKKKPLTAWTIALINVAAISNIKNFPLLAEYGLSILLYLFLSSLFFFIPAALVSAELASAWPERGIYTWVKEAMGPRLGFLAIWLQWIENVIWYPTILSFIAGTFAYSFNPELASNRYFVIGVILVAFWSATAINFLGMRVSSWISSVSALLGTILPIALIIALSGIWLWQGHCSHITWEWKGLIPDLTSINQLVLLSGVLFGLSGMEMSAVHAKEVRNPQRDYPKGILYSVLLILIFSFLGALAIGVVVPVEQIELASGGMEAFRFLFEAFCAPWAMPIIALITTFGAFGMMSTWIVGPSRGLLATAEHGDLPKIFHRVNRQGMPVAILILQAVIVTLLSSVFLFMPSVNSSYWILIALASILYQLMYVLMFISAIRLRRKQKKVEKAFHISSKIGGIWTVGLMGMIGSLFGLIVGFFPPSQFDTGKALYFEAFLIGAALLFCLIPFCIYAARKSSWRKSV